MKLLIKIFLWLALPTLMFACHDNDDSGNIRTAATQTVTFSLNVSKNSQEGSSRPESRALTVDNENTLKTVTILAFVNEEETGKFTFAYRCPGRNITSESGKTTFLVDLKQYHEKQIFVILANAEQEIASANITEGTLLNEALPKFTAVCSDEWSAKNNGSDAFRSIPMYGKTGETVITSSTKAISSITLIRMLARIDVRIKSSVTNFQLAEACVFNRKDRGFVAYEEGNWNSEKQIVTAAKVPDNAQTTKLNSILYKANDEHEIIRSIYTFESKGVTDKKEATAVIIGGYYNYPQNQELVTYYRVDIPRYDESRNQIEGSMGDILRNFLYDIEIQKVSDSGYETPEEAFNGGSVVVKANIVPWNLATMEDSSLGVYDLRVSRTVCNYMASGTTNENLTISTNSSKGWEAILIPASATSWIRWHDNTVFNEEGYLIGDKGATTLNFDITNNEIHEPRHAMLKVRVGNLTKFIDFYQTNLSGNVMDWAENDNVDFGDNDESLITGPHRLGVSRTLYQVPKNAVNGLELLVSTDNPEGWTSYIIYESGTDWLTITENGTATNADSKLLKFNLKENSSLEERKAWIIIKANNLTKRVQIIQSNISSSDGVTNIGAWDEGEQNNESFGGESSITGPSKLNISRTIYELSKSAVTGAELIIETDYPNGWFTTVTYTTGSDWLSITENGTASVAGKKTLKFNLTENASLSDRHAQIIIQAGNLKKTVYISQNVFTLTGGTSNIGPWDKQTNWDKDVSPTGYYYLSVAQTSYALPQNAQFGVPLPITTDYPGGWSVVVEPSTVKWLTITENSVVAEAGSKVLQFKATVNDTYGDRFARLVITCGNLKKNVNISQNVSRQNGANSEQTPWENDSDLDKNSLVEGYYSLSVGKTAYILSKNAQQHIPLKLFTNAPDKWKASVTGGNSWLTITDDGLAKSITTGSVTTGTLTFSVAENNTSGSRTDGEITIQMGRLKKKVIHIGQTANSQNAQESGVFDWETGKINGTIGENKHSLQVGSMQCKYDGYVEQQRAITVTGTGGGYWSASVLPCSAGEDISWITLGTTSGTADGTTQNVTFTLSPYPESAGNNERKAYLVVRLGNLQKTIVLTQYSGAAIRISGQEITYKRNSSLQTFRITAKAAWKAEVSEDAGKIIRQIRTASGVANAGGEDFYFTLNPNAGTGELSAKIKFRSINGEFDPYEVSIRTTE